MTWMKTVQNDLDSHGLSWSEAVDLAQNRPLWRLLATMQWRYALVVVQAGDDDDLLDFRYYLAVDIHCYVSYYYSAVFII